MESLTFDRRSNVKLNLKPTGIQAIARSKLKLKRPAEDDVEQVKEWPFIMSISPFYEY